MKENFSDLLYNLLPSFYKREDANLSEPLKRFLKILSEGGFEDIISSVDFLQDLQDVNKADPEYLHLIVSTMGIDFPYNMSDADRRKYIRIIPSLYKLKGTADSFNFLAREIFSTKTKVYTEAEVYEEGMTPAEWRRIFINIEVDGSLPDLQRKEENFRKFTEVIRPANRILVINLILKYFTDYRFAELVRDSHILDHIHDYQGNDALTKNFTDIHREFLTLLKELEQYDKARIVSQYPVTPVKEKSQEEQYNLNRMALTYIIRAIMTVESDTKTANTVEALATTNITLPTGASKLTTSVFKRLSSNFYTAHYEPVSPNLSH